MNTRKPQTARERSFGRNVIVVEFSILPHEIYFFLGRAHTSNLFQDVNSHVEHNNYLVTAIAQHNINTAQIENWADSVFRQLR